MYKFNKFSWSLAILYSFVVLSFEYHSHTVSLESIYYSLPLIILVIIWSERTTRIINLDDFKINIRQAFLRDLFLITFGFIFAFILPLLFEYNNSDVLGWWPVIILFGSLCGFFYAAIFSVISMAIEHHKKQTILFTILPILLISIEAFVPLNILPRYIPTHFFGNVEFFHVVMAISLVIYLLTGLYNKLLIELKPHK